LVWLGGLAWGGCAQRGLAPGVGVMAPAEPTEQAAPTVPIAPPPSRTVVTPRPAPTVTPPTPSPVEEPVEPLPEEEILITNDWPGSPVQDVLSDVALLHQVQIFVSELVRGTVTLRVENMPLEEFLANVTAIVGATYKKIGPNLYVVGPVSARSPAFPQMSETVYYPIQYIAPAQLRELLPEWMTEYVRMASTEPYALITAPATYRDQIVSTIRVVDRPQQQIALSVLVTELTEEAGRRLGLHWEWKTSENRPPPGQTEPRTGLSELTASHAETGEFVDNIGITTAGADLAHRMLVTLTSLVSAGKARIRANPSLIAQNGKPSQMEIGLERIFKIETGTVAFPRVELERLKSGVTLRLTPQVADNGDLTIELQPSVNDVVAIGKEGLPVIQTRSVQSTVRVKDGETIVIAGLVEEREQEDERKFPLLGSIPIIGRLFRGSTSTLSRREVAIFITPRILPEGSPGVLNIAP
jgi:type IV pilus assembly protein PilQ